MVVDKLVRDGSKIKAAMSTVDGKVVVTKPLTVHILDSYSSTPLLDTNDGVKFIGIFGIVVGDYYAVSNAAAMVISEPSNSKVIVINGTNYRVFSYEVGDILIDNVNLIKNKVLIFNIYNDVISKGNVPWFLSYDDICKLMDTAQLHAGVKIPVDNAIVELNAAAIGRDKTDKTKYYRNAVQAPSDKLKYKPAYVSMKFVPLNSSTTSSKLLGPYFADSVTSALVTTSKENGVIEDLLRS